MKRKKIVVFCIGTLVFNTLFWNEDLGVNFILFLLFVLLSNGDLLIKSLRNWQGIVVISGAVLASLMLIVHHSIISYISSIIAIIVLIGHLHFFTIRTSYGAFLSAMINIVKLPEFLYQDDIKIKRDPSKNWRIVRLIIIPFLIFFLFGLIFYGANLYFRNALDMVLTNIGDFLSYIFGEISIARILFFLFVACISSWIVYQGVHSFFADQDSASNLQIFRKRMRLPLNPGAMASGKRPIYGMLKTLGLKNEFTSSLIMIISICVLLFVINCIDIFTVWFGIGNDPTVNYSEAVHEGVNLLIISVLLSIGIMLYVFRRNQNFYENKQRLVFWAKVWIAQNIILIVSVIVRNYFYIAHHGLTHKRIGVFVFLIIVIAGLYSLYIKISKVKSFYFMANVNSWSLYLVLILMSTVNWDTTIAKYNVHHRNSIEIDPFYLTSMSDESVIYLWKHRIELEDWLHKSRYEEDPITSILEQRIARIQRAPFYKTHSWYSWNLRRSTIQTELKSIPKFKIVERENYRI